MYRRRGDRVEVLLAHPGGPFFKNKDEGAWTIPKGEVSEGEELLERAKIEFEEELGIPPPLGDAIDLGSVQQKGGKTVHGWALEGDLAADFKLVSNTFQISWPPRSDKMQSFPEVDRVEFFSLEEAKRKINPAQVAFLERLQERLKSESDWHRPRADVVP